MVRQKLAYAGHELRGSGGRNTLGILEGKVEGKKAEGRPKRRWLDDVRQWTMLKDNGEIRRSAQDRVAWSAITRQAFT